MFAPSRLLAATFFSALPMLGAAQNGPGLPTSTYPAGTVLAEVNAIGRVSVWHRGWWYITGDTHGGDVTVWDISEPESPVLANSVRAGSNGHDYFKIGDIFYRDYNMPIVAGTGSQYLDLSQLPALEPYLGPDLAPGRGAGQTFGSWPNEPWLYPDETALQQFDYRGVAGINSRGRLTIGNLLIQFPQNDEHGVATWDISNPDAPVLLDVLTEDINQYTTTHHVYKNHLILVGADSHVDGETYRLVGVDFSDPTNLQISYRLPHWPGRYVQFQDQYGFSADLYEGWKYNFETQEIELEFYPPSGSRFSDFYWMPVGHVLLGTGDSPGFIISHQDELDTVPPTVGYHLPAANSVNQAVTTRIGLVVHETLDETTVHDTNIIVRPLGGNPIDGLVVVTDYDVISFAPHHPLLDDTTYEVVVVQNGITDAAGNGIEEYSFRFSTGSTVDGGNQSPNAVASAAPTSGTVPLSVAFDGGSSTDPEGTNLTYAWDFGDGQSSNGVSPNHVYNAAGEYQAVLTVTDQSGAVDIDTVLIVTSPPAPGNQDPHASFSTVPASGEAPLVVTFDASASSDPDGDALTFAWDFGDGMAGDGSSVQHVYASVGTFTAVLTVDDGRGGVDSQSVTVTVSEPPPQNQAPVAGVTALPSAGAAPLQVTFEASGSFDPDGDPLSYQWDFGDGTQASGESVTHVYDVPQSYLATLTVTDPSGASDAVSVSITVDSAVEVDLVLTPNEIERGKFGYQFGTGEHPETLVAGFESPGENMGFLVFGFDIQTPDEIAVELNGSVIGYLRAGQPGQLTSANTFPIPASLQVDGTNTITFRQKTPADRWGVTHLSLRSQQGSGEPQPLQIHEVAANPPSPVVVGEPVLFTVTTSGGVGTLSYQWDFGDGEETPSVPGGAAVTHSYSSAGNYLAVLQVRDEGGAVNTVTMPLVVTEDANQLAGPTNSSPLAVAEGKVWIVNPDNDTVVAIATDTLDLVHEQAVCARPTSIAIDSFDQVWVTCRDDDSVWVLGESDGAVLAILDFGYGAGPVSVVFSPGGTAGYVAEEGAGRVSRIDPVAREVSDSVYVGSFPRALAVSGDGQRLLVSRLISDSQSGLVWSIDLNDFTTPAEIILPLDTTSIDSSNASRGVPNYLAGIAIHPHNGEAWFVGKKDNILRGVFRDGQDLTFETTLRAMIGTLDVDSGEEVVDSRVDIDDHGQPSAVAFSDSGNQAFVTMQGNNRLLVLDSNTRNELVRVDTGFAPQGVVVDPETKRVFVKDMTSRTVSVFEGASLIDQGVLSLPLVDTVSTVLNEKLTPEVLLGKQVFYNAADHRMAKDGYISCAACHLDGGHDGQVWDFTGRGEGLRNTISLLGQAGTQNGRVHWTGNFDEIQDFENDIRGAFGGTGFLTDEEFNAGSVSEPLGDPKAGISLELDALAAYVGSLSSTGRSPHRNSDGSATTDASAGEITFNSLNCSSCHSGPSLTDSAEAVLELWYRVNAGASAVSAGEWDMDDNSTPSQYSNGSVGTPFVDPASDTWASSTVSSIDMSDPSVPAGVPEAVFQSERWDPSGGSEMTWDFPVTPGVYEVRLYFAEIWDGAQNPGERVFDVAIEGVVVLDDYDTVADAGGWNRGVMKSFRINSDFNLDIDFTHVVENPSLGGIEIYLVQPGEGPRHDVGTIKASSGQRLSGPIDGLDTPSLLGLWATAPYLHDGSAATVEDVLTTFNADGLHGDVWSLSQEELDQLIDYLNQLEAP